MLALLVVALISIGTPPALAGARAHVGWLGAIVEYDPAIWRASAPSREADIVFTCIAPECEGQPIVYAYARRLPKAASPNVPRFCAADEDGSRGRRVLQPTDGTVTGHIAFVATSVWSGCRALDAPILAACAEYEGIGYRFDTTLASNGCNFGPELPLQRFVELVKGVRPALSPR